MQSSLPHRESASPAQAAAALGISVATLKRWCDDGILESIRTAGGHRRVPLHAIIQLLRTSDRASLVSPARLNLPLGSSADSRSPERVCPEFERALLAGQECGVARLAIGQYLAGRAMSEICDQLIAPAFARIGHLWTQGQAEIYEEHRACELVIRLLHQLNRLLPPASRSAPQAIGATPPGDPYALPASMIQLALKEAGWRTSTLGRCVPFDSMAGAIRTTHPSLFWLSVSIVESPDEFRKGYEQLASIAEEFNVPLVVGGRGLDRDIRRSMVYASFGDGLVHLQSFARSLANVNPADSDIDPTRNPRLELDVSPHAS